MLRHLSWMFVILLMAACQPEQAKTAYGTLERNRILLTAVDDEIVTNIYVKEGEQVKKGQLLLQLNDVSAKAKLEEAKASLSKAQAELSKLQKGPRMEVIAAMQANLARAKAELSLKTLAFNRSKNLQAKNVESESAYDAAEAAYLMSKAESEQIAAQLQELQNGSRLEDIDEAKALVDIAKANVVIATQKLSDLSIIATRNGVVDALPWHLGERVSIGSPVVVLLTGVIPFARIYIPETYRSRIRVGQSLKVLVDGYDTPFKASISKIANNPSYTPYYALTDDGRERLVYLAEALLDEKASTLANGLPVKVLL